MLTNNTEKTKKIKLVLALIYLGIIFTCLYLFFSKFTLKELTSYEFIQLNREFFFNLKNSNIAVLVVIFFLFTILWILLLGFGSPIALMGGFVFGKWLGSILVAFSLTVGATLLYIIGSYFLKNIIKSIFLKKFYYLEKKFASRVLIIMIFYRLVGLVPFGIANLLPVLFNIKMKDYFLGTFIGIFPSIFIMVSLGSGLENIVGSNNQLPNFVSIIKLPEIYLPILGFVTLVIFSLLGKNFFSNYKK